MFSPLCSAWFGWVSSVGSVLLAQEFAEVHDCHCKTWSCSDWANLFKVSCHEMMGIPPNGCNARELSLAVSSLICLQALSILARCHGA